MEGGSGAAAPALASIPHTLHQIWLGPRPAPAEWMATWRRAHPSWRYQVWGDAELSEFGLVTPILRGFIDAGIYDGAADIARVEILAAFGGVYADADSVCLRPLDDAPFMAAGFFATREEPPDGSRFVTNAFMGSAPHHAVIERYRARLRRRLISSHCAHGGTGAAFCCAWRYTGPMILTDVLRRSHEPDVEVLEPWVFFTETIKGAPIDGGEPYARHYWSSTGERTADKTLFPASVPYLKEAGADH